MNKANYPDNWDAIARAVKERANWHCEDCARPCRRPGESWEQLSDRLEPTPWYDDLWEAIDDDEVGEVIVYKYQRFTLTVAHLNHLPRDCRPQNLRALCSVCHLRYDARQHAKTRRRNRFLQLEAHGQLNLFSQEGDA